MFQSSIIPHSNSLLLLHVTTNSHRSSSYLFLTLTHNQSEHSPLLMSSLHLLQKLTSTSLHGHSTIVTTYEYKPVYCSVECIVQFCSLDIDRIRVWSGGLWRCDGLSLPRCTCGMFGMCLSSTCFWTSKGDGCGVVLVGTGS